MVFPNFTYCVVCDMVRPELGGKVILLGFYGLTPEVLVPVANISHPVVLSILAAFPPPPPEAKDPYEFVMSIARPDGVGIFQTPPIRLAVSKGRGVALPLAFNIPPPILSGRYTVRILVDGELKMDTSFSVGTPAQTELNRQPTGVVARG